MIERTSSLTASERIAVLEERTRMQAAELIRQATEYERRLTAITREEAHYKQLMRATYIQIVTYLISIAAIAAIVWRK